MAVLLLVASSACAVAELDSNRESDHADAKLFSRFNRIQRSGLFARNKNLCATFHSYCATALCKQRAIALCSELNVKVTTDKATVPAFDLHQEILAGNGHQACAKYHAQCVSDACRSMASKTCPKVMKAMMDHVGQKEGEPANPDLKQLVQQAQQAQKKHTCAQAYLKCNNPVCQTVARKACEELGHKVTDNRSK